MPGLAGAESDLDVLRSEVKDKVSDLEQLFLALEQALREGRPPIEAVHLILRQAHSLKGSLGMADRPAASLCVHTMEAAFVSIREGRLGPSRELFDLAFASLDELGRLADSGSEDRAAFAKLTSGWEAMQQASVGKAPVAADGLPFALSPEEAEPLRRACGSDLHLFLVAKSILSDITREEYDGLAIYEDVASLGTLLARRPAFADIDRKQREAVLLLLVATSHDAQALKDEIFDPFRPVQLSQKDRTAYLDHPAPPPEPKAAPARLRSLIVEDDFTSRLVLQKFLSPFGEPHIAVDGEEALLALRMALDAKEPYQLICLDIMMPRFDGHATLSALRQMEEARGYPLGKGSKVLMTTCLKDKQHIMDAFRGQCDAYLVKPVERPKLLEQLRRLGLLAG